MVRSNEWRAVRIISTAAIFVLILSGPIARANQNPKPKAITTSGTIVAYTRSLVCLNGVSTWSAILLLERVKAGGSRYAEAIINLPCDKTPHWTSTPAHVQKLKLVRDADRDVVLEKVVMKLVQETGQSEPEIEWHCRSGADCSAIPYGKVVPVYEFVGSLPIL